MSRIYSSEILDLLEQGIVSWESFARSCITYMSEDDVQDLCISEGFIEEDDEEEDDE